MCMLGWGGGSSLCMQLCISDEVLGFVCVHVFSSDRELGVHLQLDQGW